MLSGRAPVGVGFLAGLWSSSLGSDPGEIGQITGSTGFHWCDCRITLPSLGVPGPTVVHALTPPWPQAPSGSCSETLWLWPGQTSDWRVHPYRHVSGSLLLHMTPALVSVALDGIGVLLRSHLGHPDPCLEESWWL